MGLFASSILVKYSLLNNSGSLVYAGTSSNSLRIWGAQLELAEYSEDILNDYINNYRYVRTTGQVQNFYGIRFGSGVNGDQSVDSILIGGSSGTRMNNVYAENTAFFVDKSPLRGLDLGTAQTVSSQLVVTSSYTISSVTNLINFSEQFTNGTAWVTGGVTISSNVINSPDGTSSASKIVETSGSTITHGFYQTRYALENENVTFSIFAKAAERSELLVQISNVNEAAQAIFNLSSQTATVITPGSLDYTTGNTTASMVSFGDGWWKLNVTTKKSGYASYNQANISLLMGRDGNYTYTGDGRSGLYIWGAHLAQNSFTNLSLYSEEIHSEAWVSYGFNNQNFTTANMASAPDGTFTADSIAFFPAGYRYILYQLPRVIPNTTYTFSSWIWSSSAGTKIGLRLSNHADGGDQSNTSITLTTTPTRYSITRTFTGGSVPNSFYIDAGFDKRVGAGGDDTTGTIIVWGAQLEAGSSASAYVKTTSTPVTVSSYVATLGYPLYVRTTSNLAIATNTSAGFTVPVSSNMNLIDSGDFTNSGRWTDVSFVLSRTSIAGAAPDGNAAYLLVDSNFGPDGAGAERTLTVAASTTNVYTFSLYVKQYDINTAYVDLYAFFIGGTTRGSYIRYNFGPQTVVPNIGPEGGLLPFNAGVQQVGNGWARIYFSVYDNVGNNTTMLYRFYPSSRDAVRGACYAYGPQVSLYNLTTQVGPVGLTEFALTTGSARPYVSTSGISVSYTSLTTNFVTTTSFTLSQTFSGTTTISGADHDRIFVGQQYRADTRLSGDPLERLSFAVTQRIKDTPGVDGTGVTVSDDRRRIPSNPVFDATKVAGLELLKKTNQTFSYNTFTPVAGDNVYYNANDWFSEVGRSQRARMAIGGDTEVHFFNKRLDEIKQIPQNPRFDALRVMGLEPIYKTSSIITLSKYTPVHNSDYTYYKRYDWFSEVPRSQRARSALGIGNGSPLMFDNLQFVEDFISLPTKGLFETVPVGSQGPLVNPIYTTVDLSPITTTGNLVLYSEELNQAPWQVNRGTRTADWGPGNPDPRGTGTADLVSSNRFDFYLRQPLSRTITSGSVVRFTVWVKFFFLLTTPVRMGFMYAGDNTVTGFSVNPSTLVWTISDFYGVISAPAVTAASNGYYKYTFLLTAGTTLTPANTYVGFDQGQSGQGFTAWGVNVTEGTGGPGGTPEIPDANTYTVTTSSYIGYNVTLQTTSVTLGNVTTVYNYPTTSILIGYGAAPESTNYIMLQAVKRGKDDLYIINNRHQTSSDAIQTQEIFYNKPGSIFGRSWYQLAPYFSSYSTIFDGKYGSDNVRVGDYYGGVRHSNNKQETIAIWFAPKPRAEITIATDTPPAKIDQKTALRSSYSSTTVQTVIRTNRIAHSERLDRTGFWGTTGATVTTSTALLSPLLPYRAVGYDADQLHELFYNQPRQPQYKKWYTIVPLTARTQSWTSNAINIISVSSSNSQHGAATLINFNVGTDNYYSYGMFVKQRVGVNRVRLYVGLPNLTTSIVDLMELGSDFEVPHYADFDLVAGTVLNRLNVSYANITDRGNGWKLIKIAGPVSGTADAVIDTLPVFRDFVDIRDSLELSSALFDLAPGDLLALNGAVDLTDTGGIEELL